MPQIGSPQDTLNKADRWLASCKEAQDPQTRLIRDLQRSLDEALEEQARLRRELARMTELLTLPATGS